MRSGMKMMLMSSGRNRGNYGRSDGEDNYRESGYSRYGGAREYYDGGAEDRFRDRRGREHYDNGRYAPQNESGMWVDSRSDSKGRYARNEYDNEMRDDYGSRYDTRESGRVRNDYRQYPSPVYRDQPKMHKIGFSVDGEMERLPELSHDYRSSADYHDMDEFAHRKGSERMSGYGSTNSVPPMNREMAMEWTENMQNEDGTTGPHWSMEKTKQVMAQKGIECDPLEFYVALNATYSDLSPVFKKYGINNIDAYVDFAKAFWLKDKDAQPDKLSRYYMNIVKH